MRRGFREADFTPTLFEVFTQTTLFGLTFQADRARFWASWFGSGTLEFRRFVSTLALVGMDAASTGTNPRLKLLGQEIGPFQALIDNTLHEFEENRVTQAARAEVESEAVHHLGDLGSTFEEAVEIMLAEYDYGAWWNQIIIKTGPDDHELYDRLQAALSPHIPPLTKRPIRQPALFDRFLPGRRSIYAIHPQSLARATSPPSRQSFADWRPDDAIKRLARRPGQRNDRPNAHQSKNRGSHDD
jgi:hypothetical protein